MLIVQICVGSSCHLKGSADIAERFQKAIEDNGMQDDIVLTGSLCIGKCNRIGVTIQVNDDIHVGVTRENFRDFFNKNVLAVIESERG